MGVLPIIGRMPHAAWHAQHAGVLAALPSHDCMWRVQQRSGASSCLKLQAQPLVYQHRQQMPCQPGNILFTAECLQIGWQ